MFFIDNGFILISYLDPGTGSLIIQLVVGAIIGTLVLFRGWFASLLGMFGINPGKDEDDDIEDVDDVEEQQ